MSRPILSIVLLVTAAGLTAGIVGVRMSARVDVAEPIEAANSPGAASAAVEGSGMAASTPPGDRAAGFSWSDLESDDYGRYIANLRAVGCPEQTIRDIIVADVSKLYAPREAPLRARLTAGRSGNAPDPGELENRRQLREVQVEKAGVLRQLLGIDVPLDLLPSGSSRGYDSFELAFKLLPPEKRDAVQLAQENYWQQSDALKARFNNQRTPEFVEEYRRLNASLREELSRILTPIELEDYELRTSAVASRLSQQTSAFGPSEEEYRQIYRIQREMEEEAGRAADAAGGGKAVGADQKAAAMARLNGRLREALGDERFQEYQRAQDYNYQTLQRLGQRYNLGRESILQAYELERSFRTSLALAPGTSAATIADRAALLQQYNDAMQAALGEKAARAFRRVRGGFTAPEMDQ